MGSESDAGPAISTDHRATETAARIFFQLVGFCQNTLGGMPKDRQVTVFQQHWASLFVLQACESRAITSRQIRNETFATASEKQKNEVSTVEALN